MNRESKGPRGSSRSEAHSGAPFFEPRWAAAALESADPRAEASLRPEERVRAQGYQEGRPRRDFVAGRILARRLAADLLNEVLPAAAATVCPEDFELTQYCGNCASNAHGPMRLRMPASGWELAISYARTAGWILLGLAPGGHLLGVDLVDLEDQAFAGGPGYQLEDYAFAAQEREILGRLPEPERRMARARAWSLKEAVAKASGGGLAGENGIPVVAGSNVHPLLGLERTRVMELPPGSRDLRETSPSAHQLFANPLSTNQLPDNLHGCLLWVTPVLGGRATG